MYELLGINEDFPIMLFRLLMAFILIGAIGYERDKKGKNAGLRTHLLVGVGACSLILVSIYGIFPFASEKGISIDMARIPSYIISGIGFLGAGTIITTQNRVMGLSTAATIWVVAIIGIMIGFGMIAFAFFVTMGTIFILHVLVRFDI